MPLGALFALKGNFNSGEENSKPESYFLTWLYFDFLTHNSCVRIERVCNVTSCM